MAIAAVLLDMVAIEIGMVDVLIVEIEADVVLGRVAS